MEEVINLKKKQLNDLMNEIEQNLMLLNQEDFDSLVHEYSNRKEIYVNLLYKSNEIPITNMSISLDALIEMYKEFNDNICINYNLQGKTCLAV